MFPTTRRAIVRQLCKGVGPHQRQCNGDEGTQGHSNAAKGKGQRHKHDAEGCSRDLGKGVIHLGDEGTTKGQRRRMTGLLLHARTAVTESIESAPKPDTDAL